MNSSTHLFVFLTSPGYPVVVDAVFKIEDLNRALELYKHSGYHVIRHASWNYGKLPTYEQTKSITENQGVK